jgi:hypothetical protein
MTLSEKIKEVLLFHSDAADHFSKEELKEIENSTISLVPKVVYDPTRPITMPRAVPKPSSAKKTRGRKAD